MSAVAISLFVAATAWVSVHPRRSEEHTPGAEHVTPMVASPPKDRREERLAATRAIVRALAPAASRRLPERTEREKELHQLATSLGAPGTRLENPCVEWAGPFCARTALEPLFSALDGLRAGTSSSRVTISAFGNSLIAADRIVDVVREDLVHLFGDGGRGLLLVDRIADYGPRTRSSQSATGWQVYTVGDVKPAPLPLGLTGVSHVSTTPKARARFELSGETQGAVYWVDQDAGPIELRIDGELVVTTTPSDTGGQQRTEVTIPPGAKALELIAHRKGTIVQGVALDRGGPGLVLDTLGVPAADASLFLQADEEMVTEQLRSRAPALVMMMLGGNEVKRLQWGRSTIEKVERDLHRFIQRVKTAAPGSACLLVGPLDAVLGPDASRPFQQRADLLEVLELERRIAQEEGCAFFDMFTAMGGTGSLQRMHARGLVHDDLVHPRGKGLDLLGELMAEALLRSWSDTPRTEQPYALAEAWATLVGGDLLPHEAHPWRSAPPVALLLPEAPQDPLSGGIHRVLSASRAWTPRSEEARWVVLGAEASQSPPRPIAVSGPADQRCVTFVSESSPARGGEPCLPVALPPLPPDLQDPLHRGVAAGAWLLAEIVRHDALSATRSPR
ncbi:GDSL-type esterase/lipase family protein [Hyalangium rubrum]|uniref:GDSL-type esterase/lipase family protein n=1 Tax=Hyalangium rubrum TaxID=3103134 RepID=A0ABU5GWA2_9BACT|nr:GDSL-type esterase/lipase family protein [Hyalangium sp. s54d21]MDY7225473.1 GDSL-type esterase/lipase family protein [Hyalangium sp. s54d21]